MFGALSDRVPGVLNHIGKYFALGPVAFLKNAKVKLLRFAAKGPLEQILNILNINTLGQPIPY